MKKLLALFLLLAMGATNVFAVADNPTATIVGGGATTGQPSGRVNVNYEGQSNFGQVAAWGNTTPGNPGYLVLKGCDASNACFPYYFWVASDGKLYLASYIAISQYSSFPSGSWNRNGVPIGTVVGSQS